VLRGIGFTDGDDCRHLPSHLSSIFLLSPPPFPPPPLPSLSFPPWYQHSFSSSLSISFSFFLSFIFFIFILFHLLFPFYVVSLAVSFPISFCLPNLLLQFPVVCFLLYDVFPLSRCFYLDLGFTCMHFPFIFVSKLPLCSVLAFIMYP